ncbi:MAG: DnaJ family molecular chaperone [Hyphomicrobiaceae bacterium]
MFERNKIDTVEHSGVAVAITTDDGERLTGRILIPMGRTLVDVLNNTGGFVEFEPWGGERVLVAKSSLRTVKLTQAPRVESLKGRTSQDGFDPHAILGVAADADIEVVKAAWHRLSKAYHPDRYATAELPQEVMDYLSGMARRINAAYAALEVPLQSSRRAAQMRSQPIFTSRPRA